MIVHGNAARPASRAVVQNGGRFAFEDLLVWRRAIEFAGHVVDATERCNGHHRLVGQIESAATSVASNIAEGKGRYSKKEFAQFLYIARGSLYETVSLLTLFGDKQWIGRDDVGRLHREASEIVKMINGLLQSVKGKSHA